MKTLPGKPILTAAGDYMFTKKIQILNVPAPLGITFLTRWGFSICMAMFGSGRLPKWARTAWTVAEVGAAMRPVVPRRPGTNSAKRIAANTSDSVLLLFRLGSKAGGSRGNVAPYSVWGSSVLTIGARPLAATKSPARSKVLCAKHRHLTPILTVFLTVCNRLMCQVRAFSQSSISLSRAFTAVAAPRLIS